MKKIKALLLKLLFPARTKKLRDLEEVMGFVAQLTGAQVHNPDQLYWALVRLVNQHKGLQSENADCLEALISLVSINEDGHWSTVFDADTLLPNHIQDYLHRVVARS